MDPSACLYEILGVPPGATKKEIRAAYQRRAQRWHPDRHGGSEVATRNFIAVRNAFETLHDDRKRAQYDTSRTKKEDTQRESPVSHSPVIVGKRGDDLRIFATVPLRLLLEGGPLETVGLVGSVCRKCRGSGCSVCRGSGQVLVQRHWLVNIPAGFAPNRLLRFSNEGHTGPFFARPGDVYIHLRPRPAHGWRWNAARERLEKVVKVPAMFLRKGGRLKIRSPNGAWGHVQIPSSSASCHWVFIPNQGLQISAGGRGMWLCVEVGLWFSWRARRARES